MTMSDGVTRPGPTGPALAMKSRDGGGQQPTTLIQKREGKNPKEGKRGGREPASPLRVLHTATASHREVPAQSARPPPRSVPSSDGANGAGRPALLKAIKPVLPHHILTAVTILDIDLGHHLGRPLPTIIGAGAFTGRVDRGAVDFTLDTFVLAPTDTSSSLLSWLDLALYDEHATVTGYDLGKVTAALDALPDAGWSSALRQLSRYGHRRLIDTVLRGPDHQALEFVDAALSAGIPTTVPDSDLTFNAWMTGRQAVLAGRLATDAIASWRLTMSLIADRSSLGHRVNAAIERHLIDWLHRQGTPAAALHLDSLARTGG
jgi:hypothetical protein